MKRISLEQRFMDDEAARRAKALKVKIVAMEKKILRYKNEEYPQKKLHHIFRKIEYHYGPFGLAVAIARVLRTQRKDLSPEERIDVEQERQNLLSKRPDLKEQVEALTS